MMSIRIGISGWTYAPWRKKFYPPGLPQKNELLFASRQVSSIEINGTFYALQRPTSFLHWYAQTPSDFIFSIKGGRYITHIRRLREIEEPLANFFASGVLALGEKLGPLLWQFPPNFKYERERIETFLKLLPRDTRAAARLARRHSVWMGDQDPARVYASTNQDRPIRHAIEVRNESFRDPTFFKLLRKHGVALVISHSSGKWPMFNFEDATAPFAYLRLHGEGELYSGGYGNAALDSWAEQIRNWGKDTYVYFDNDAKVHAPFDAISLSRKLAIETTAQAA